MAEIIKPTQKKEKSPRSKKCNSNKIESSETQISDQKEENVWIDECEKSESISSESNFEMPICTRQHVISNRCIWNKDEIILALGELPAGPACLQIIENLRDGEFKQIISNVEHEPLCHISKSLLHLPEHFSEPARKLSMSFKNEASGFQKNVIDMLLNWPNTCLMIACCFNKIEIVEFLLERGASVNTRDSKGRVPLHLSAQRRASKITKELLNFGAEPNVTDLSERYTPLHCASASGDIVSIEYLIQHGADVNSGLAGKTPLYYAVTNNFADCVELLLQNGAFPNNYQVYTETPLHVAASLGSAKCTKLLLNYGAFTKVQCGNERSTPLHLAAEEGSFECTKLLLNSGAEPNVKNSRGQSPLHLAALVQCVDTLQVLLSSKANVNIEDNNGRTPLHAAVARALRGFEAVQILIKEGASVNKPDKFGYTSLHIAALNENSQLVKFLISSGADITKKTRGNASAFSFIVRRTPDVLPYYVSMLDNSILLGDYHQLGDIDCEFKVDFRPLASGSQGETSVIKCLIKAGQGHILQHPLCEAFLYLKWLRIRKFYLLSLIFHSIFVTVYTTYICSKFLWENSDFEWVFWLVVFFTFILVCKELFQVAHGIGIYAKGSENALQWSVIISSGLTLLHSRSGDWQHHIAAIGIFLAWLELMMIVGRFPLFGLYIQMFTQVAINFIKFLGTYICLIIGFSLAFSVLLKNHKAYKNPLIGFIKTIIMMSGELEFEDLFFDDDSKILFSGTSHLMLLAFVILVTIILANLMMGLAVSDIQELQRSAGLERLIRRAHLIAHLENLLFSKLFNYAPKRFITLCQSSALLSSLPYFTLTIRPNDPRENRLPKDLIKSMYCLVSERKKKYKSRGISSIPMNDFHLNSRCSSLYKDLAFTSFNELQISNLAMEVSKSTQNIEHKVDFLIQKVETIAKELNIIP